MTASRRPGLTFGEPRSTSDTSDLDTPARAATVSSVGLRSARAAPADVIPDLLPALDRSSLSRAR